MPAHRSVLWWLTFSVCLCGRKFYAIICRKSERTDFDRRERSRAAEPLREDSFLIMRNCGIGETLRRMRTLKERKLFFWSPLVPRECSLSVANLSGSADAAVTKKGFFPEISPSQSRWGWGAPHPAARAVTMRVLDDGERAPHGGSAKAWAAATGVFDVSR